ncbi:MAG: hypothetical protein OEW69_12055 [Nitrospirota bacterium]|nr:hypothetical protein [Nitrospirota bacterium]
MKGKDLYTKIVLTIIAVSLVILVLQNFFQVSSIRASAKYNPNDIPDVNIAKIGGHPVVLREGNAIYSDHDVNIRQIGGRRVYINEE